MTYILSVFAGLAIGGLSAWLIASARVRKPMTVKEHYKR
jgi:hypothetical protein